MIKLLHDRGVYPIGWYLSPDTGGSGGGSPAGAQGNGGQNGGPGGAKTPFDDLPWDELDDGTKAQLEKIKGDFVATLQKSTKLEADLTKTQDLQRRFQADFDRLKAEHEKRNAPPEKDEYLESVRKTLTDAGYSKEEVDKMAPTFASMFKAVTGVQKKEIGHDLAPMAATVLGREAEAAFYNAQQSDTLGMFQDNEIAQAVWNAVQERTKAGEPTNANLVANLAKIYWADKQAQSKTGPNPPTPPDPNAPKPFNFPGMRTGLTYPGAGNAPAFNAPADPNAPKTKLDSDTAAALETTFKIMTAGTDAMPKAFAKKGGRSR
jgi:hypothetical protein